MPAHPRPLLLLAQACHPGRPGAERAMRMLTDLEAAAEGYADEEPRGPPRAAPALAVALAAAVALAVAAWAVVRAPRT